MGPPGMFGGLFDSIDELCLFPREGSSLIERQKCVQD